MLIETQYFPCIAFWAKALKDKELCLEKYENYQKRSYRNKCKILSANNPLILSIPLSKGKNSQTPITEVTIAETENWRENHLQSIRSSYGSSPYFEFYWEDIEQLITSKEHHLYAYNLAILQYFSRMFSIPIIESIQYEREPYMEDCRQSILPKSSYDFTHSYVQVFGEKHDFIPNLSIIDLLFCKGPESVLYLKKIGQEL